MHESSHSTPATVVVCDDRPELRDAIRAVLAGNPGFTVVAEAADGSGCLEIIRRTRPDILILDVSMPGGGPGVARAIKAIAPNVHILVYTGRPDLRMWQDMLDAGADQYLVKTGRLRPLIDALECGLLASN